MTVSSDCGCCGGAVAAVATTALATANRPGLPALSFRVGTHATFMAEMKARLSSADLPALAQGLRTRDSSDFSIALLDSWAILADVLAFYQERIANEGYIRTATERFSVVELARLVGYELRPGVAASVYLAYTLNDGPEVPIPVGARVQSTPGPDETPQIFETAEVLRARADWNNLKPRSSQLPDITSDNIGTTNTVHFTGATNNLKAGDLLLFNFSGKPSVTRLIQSVTIVFKDDSKNIKEDRTDVQLVPLVVAAPAQAKLAAAAAAHPDRPELRQFVELAHFGASGLVLAAAARDLVAKFPDDLDTASVLSTVFSRAAITRAGATATATPTVELRRAATAGVATAAADVAATASGLQNLVTFLRRAPTVQPLNSARLVLNRQQIFSAKSDVGPQVLHGFFPELQGNIYLAFSTPQPAQEVFVFRQTAFLFGNNAPKKSLFERPTPVINIAAAAPAAAATVTADGDDWAAEDEDPSVAFLDNAYPSLLPGDFFLIESPTLTAADGTSQKVFLGTVAAAAVHARSAYRVSSPTTEVRFAQAWWTPSMETIRDAVVHTKPEKLTLAREPITDPIGGDADLATTIELDRVYPGLAPGRWIIVAGDQVVSDGVTIPGAERVMIAAVDQNGLLPSSSASSSGGGATGGGTTGGGTTGGGTIGGGTIGSGTTGSGVSLGNASSGDTPAPLPDDPHTVLTLAGSGLAFTYRRDTVQIFGNVVLATHGETRNEVLGAGDATRSLQTFTIKKPPLTFVPAPTASGIAGTLQVTVNDIIWQQAQSLAFLGPNDRGYVVRVEDDGTTAITFGTGTQGARLPTGVENVKAVYRSGIGRPGNVNAGQLNLLQTRPLGVKDVVNPLPATGGADADSRDQARRNAPQSVTALDRLVSVADYATFSRAFAGIGKATAERVMRNGRPRIHVTVSGQENAPITPGSLLLSSLTQALHDLGDPSLPIEVTVCPLAFLFISGGVKIGADRVWEAVVSDVRNTLLDTFSFDRRDVGQSVFLSEVIAAIQNVSGVDYVDLDALAAVSETDVAGAASLDPILAGLASGELPDPPIVRGRDSTGESLVVYLNPTLPDLLILRELTP